jgi:hypothetical protein
VFASLELLEGVAGQDVVLAFSYAGIPDLLHNVTVASCPPSAATISELIPPEVQLAAVVVTFNGFEYSQRDHETENYQCRSAKRCVAVPCACPSSTLASLGCGCSRPAAGGNRTVCVVRGALCERGARCDVSVVCVVFALCSRGMSAVWCAVVCAVRVAPWRACFARCAVLPRLRCEALHAGVLVRCGALWCASGGVACSCLLRTCLCGCCPTAAQLGCALLGVSRH